jgi:hypothetical protein
MRAAGFFIVLLILLAGCGEGSVIAPEPARDFSLDVDSLPPLVPGTIVAPLSLDLQGALTAMEEAVPRRIGNINNRQKIGGKGRKSFAFEVEREPFSVNFAGDTVLLAAVIQYRGRGWYDPPIGPDINGECGTEKIRPRARLAVRVIAELTPQWQLRVTPRAIRVTPLTTTERDQCEVTFARINVTGRVLEAAETVLRSVLPGLGRKLSRTDVRTPLQNIWVGMQRPIRISDSLWLLLNPLGVNLGGIHGERHSVGAEVGVTAAPRIVSGEKPVVASTPLPALGPMQLAQGFSILVEGVFDYGVMGALLTEKLRNRQVQAAGGVLTVKRVTVFGVGGGRLALGLDFTGSARGRVWFLGTPVYDRVSGYISVPDLDFDATSAGMLVQGVAWLKGDAIRQFLRDQAKVPAGDLMARVQALAAKEMNRDLARGVRLSASIASTQPAGLLVRGNGLILRAHATGSARLDLGPELFAPKDTLR